MPLRKPLLGSRHLHALGSQALAAGHVHTEAPGTADCEPPPQGVQGARPSASPKVPASHWQLPLAGAERAGHDVTQRPALHSPDAQSSPEPHGCATSALHEPLATTVPLGHKHALVTSQTEPAGWAHTQAREP